MQLTHLFFGLTLLVSCISAQSVGAVCRTDLDCRVQDPANPGDWACVNKQCALKSDSNVLADVVCAADSDCTFLGSDYSCKSDVCSQRTGLRTWAIIVIAVVCGLVVVGILLAMYCCCRSVFGFFSCCIDVLICRCCWGGDDKHQGKKKQKTNATSWSSAPLQSTYPSQPAMTQSYMPQSYSAPAPSRRYSNEYNSSLPENPYKTAENKAPARVPSNLSSTTFQPEYNQAALPVAAAAAAAGGGAYAYHYGQGGMINHNPSGQSYPYPQHSQQDYSGYVPTETIAHPYYSTPAALSPDYTRTHTIMPMPTAMPSPTPMSLSDHGSLYPPAPEGPTASMFAVPITDENGEQHFKLALPDGHGGHNYVDPESMGYKLGEDGQFHYFS